MRTLNDLMKIRENDKTFSVNEALGSIANDAGISLVVTEQGVMNDGDFELLCEEVGIDYNSILYGNDSAVILGNNVGLDITVAYLVDGEDSYFDFDN